MSDKNQIDPETPLTGSSLLSMFRRDPNERFTVDLKNNDGVTVSLTFKTFADSSEYVELRKKATAFAEMLAGDRIHPSFKEFAITDPTDQAKKEVAVGCYWIHTLSVEPKLGQRECLALAKECGQMMDYLYNVIQIKIGDIVPSQQKAEIEGLCED